MLQAHMMICGADGALPRPHNCLAHLGSAERRIDPSGDKSGGIRLSKLCNMASSQTHPAMLALLEEMLALNASGFFERNDRSRRRERRRSYAFPRR